MCQSTCITEESFLAMRAYRKSDSAPVTSCCRIKIADKPAAVCLEEMDCYAKFIGLIIDQEDFSFLF